MKAQARRNKIELENVLLNLVRNTNKGNENE